MLAASHERRPSEKLPDFAVAHVPVVFVVNVTVPPETR